ncbi:hypothetical protein [Nocardia sp. NPDC004260]
MTSKITRYRRIFGEGVELDNRIAEKLTLADWEAVQVIERQMW